MNPLDNFKCDWKCSQLAKTLCVFVPRHPVVENCMPTMEFLPSGFISCAIISEFTESTYICMYV